MGKTSKDMIAKIPDSACEKVFFPKPVEALVYQLQRKHPFNIHWLRLIIISQSIVNIQTNVKKEKNDRLKKQYPQFLMLLSLSKTNFPYQQHLINVLMHYLSYFIVILINIFTSSMRSLIKMEVLKPPSSNVIPINQLPYQEQQSRYTGIATHHSMRNSAKKNSINNNTILNNNKNEYLSEHLSQMGQQKKIVSQRKVSLEKYISDLTTDIENPKNEPDFGETKLKVLKRIIQHYDIKTMQKNHYSKLIKTFGLQIQSVKTDRKQIQSHHQNRTFKIKFSTRAQSRKERANSKMQIKEDGEVALLEFSKQIKPVSRRSSFIDPKIVSENLAEKQKERFRISSNNKEKNIKQNSFNNQKKLSPFKFKSTQDVLVDKTNKYREFLFILNCSNRLYRKMDLESYEKPLKYFIGVGNNSNLIRALMKKRYYFEQTQEAKEANFVWTQIKVDSIFIMQQNSKFWMELFEGKKKPVDKKSKPTTNPEFEENLRKILTKSQTNFFIKAYEQINRKLAPTNFQDKLKYLDRKINISSIEPSDKIHNHLPANGLLGNKKGLFYCLREYYKISGKNVWDILPLTFHISKGIFDNDFKQFTTYFNQRKKNKLSNVWIMKPGEFSNRGNGISCSNKFDDIRKRISKCHVGRNGQVKTLILQLYISNPLLYNNRKFDIRTYMLVTSHNGKIKAYWYQQGYIRTSSYTFDLSQLSDTDIHLTNDAIQKKSEDYGKFEPGNKLSYSQLQRYLDNLPALGRNLDFYSNALPKMKEIAAQSVMSSFMFLDQQKKENNFQIFGLDFMLDYNLKPWLIEINTNPCLQLSCPLLERIIPHMVENAFRIGLDTIFPPPDYVPHNYKYNIAQNALHYNKFELIFDEQRDGPQVRSLYEAFPGSSALISSLMGIKEDQQVYKEQGILCDYNV